MRSEFLLIAKRRKPILQVAVDQESDGARRIGSAGDSRAKEQPSLSSFCNVVGYYISKKLMIGDDG